MLTGPVGQHNGSGGNMTGIFHGKMILQESLMDPDAHPWGADWYKWKVEQAVGGKKANDTLRVYMQDHAQHGAGTGGGTSTRTVSYLGALQQALRDAAAWVERGEKAPASTNYKLDGGQVLVPDNAAVRKAFSPSSP